MEDFKYRETPGYDADAVPVLLESRVARAIVRARRQGLQAEHINEHLRAVRSRSKATCFKHLVSVVGGKVSHCSDCPAWEFRNFCDHSGIVTWQLLVELNGRREAEAILAESLTVADDQADQRHQARLADEGANRNSAEAQRQRDNAAIESPFTRRGQLFRNERMPF